MTLLLLAVLLAPSGDSAGLVKQSPPSPVVVVPGPVQGAAKLQIHVGTDGHATSCQVLESSGNADDDSRVCRFFGKYAHPNIRRDAQGKPMEYDNTFFVDPSALKQLRDAGI